jgi:hypothetical protein
MLPDSPHDAARAPAATVSPADDPTDEQRILEQVVAQTPTAVAVVLGPDHEFRYFNEAYLALVPAGRVRVGRRWRRRSRRPSRAPSPPRPRVRR